MKATLIIGFTVILSFFSTAQELPKDTSKAITVSPDKLSLYTGHYKLKAMSLVIEIALEETTLFAIVAGTGRFPLFADSDTTFFNNDIQVQIKFPNTGSKAQKLVLYQAGQQMTGDRISPPVRLDYEKVLVGDKRIDNSKIFSTFESKWDLIIQGNQVGTAIIHLRHAIYQGQPAYHGGSVIRYTAMGNKPFADVEYISKTDYRMLQKRNAISQEAEVTSTLKNTKLTRHTLNMNTGKITETKSFQFEEPVFGMGIYKLLSMELKPGMTIQLPVSGFDNIVWERAHISGREEIYVDALDRNYQTWKVEYASGTIKWITDKAPYLIKWQMPTGIVWKLKAL